MKLIVAVVQSEDAGGLENALTSRQYRVTRINTAGGFLKAGNATFLVGVVESEVDEVLDIIRENCKMRTQQISPMPPITEPGEFYMPYPIEVDVGGATVFVISVDRFEQL